MSSRTEPAGLATIPILDVEGAFPLETLVREEARAHALLDSATRHVPRAALRTLDEISRRWLLEGEPAHLAEVEAIARRLQRPGAYFLSVNYEWGCTCRVAPDSERRSARLVRVLDWRTPGLGRNLIATRVKSPAGRFVTLGWPGYTGVLQAVAPGRFAAALNQAPMRKSVGWMPADWAVNRVRIWRSTHRTTPAHLLRHVFEHAAAFAEAKSILTRHPIAAPAIFSIAGTKPGELAVIERQEITAHVHDGPGIAANHWQAPGWHGRPRGNDSAGRACRMATMTPEFDPAFSWLAPPILNDRTRLVMIADATSGRVMVQGFESTGRATAVLDMVA